MDISAIITIVVAVVAAGSAYASSRAASRASVLNVTTTSRVDMEKEAYDRARKFDVETIDRLEGENKELRAEIVGLRERIAVLEEKLRGQPRTL